MKPHWHITAAFMLSAAIASADAQPPLKIASLHPVLTGIARETGGGLVSITGVLPPGVDPHVFEPSAIDLRAIVNADLILAAGLGRESYLDRRAGRAGASGRILSAGDMLPDALLLRAGGGGHRHDGHRHDEHEHDAHAHAPPPTRARAAAATNANARAAANDTGADSDTATAAASAAGADSDTGAAIPHSATRDPHSADPHWWQSVDCVSFIAGRIGGELALLRPESADVFARNTRACQRRLAALKAWAAAEIARIPPARRHLVTSHDAFGYLARDYGFEIHPLSGLSTDGEPDARRLAALIRLIRGKNIPAVFAENNASPRVIANLVSETGARTGGTLYADGPGPADSGAATYEAMYRHNIRTLVEALAPE
ncbi:MAG: metal ABC transporter substrate-binding protein [Opitutaceae bacterium]|jgi:zinc/manganese transport system substrate-binding protein|nr:metal ABC transporter substrate-binding protein [Opitutaceae bacterium]